MSKRLSSKFKVCRRYNVALWGDDDDPSIKRNYIPGQHGRVMRVRHKSNYSRQLAAKQILKSYYGEITERQFRKYYDKAINARTNSSDALVGLLESRLSTVIYRCNFVPSVFASRQFINHRHLLVNGKKVNIASYLLKDGDVITLTEKSKSMVTVLEAIQKKSREVPAYLSVDYHKFEITFLRKPTINEVPYPVKMEPNLVIEYYSQ